MSSSSNAPIKWPVNQNLRQIILTGGWAKGMPKKAECNFPETECLNEPINFPSPISIMGGSFTVLPDIATVSDIIMGTTTMIRKVRNDSML